ncbi:mitochondrial genome maintenance MGM101, partial [Gaertneriomyces semiglobifer]
LKGFTVEPFPKNVANILQMPVNEEDVEMKPDGLIYLPEIKYRRILNQAFGPGGWGMIPHGPHSIENKRLSREYALYCLGRFVAQARGAHDFNGDESKLPIATEAAKSNALMRCCKDLGVASELWDPVFIAKFRKRYCQQEWVQDNSGRKKYIWMRIDRPLPVGYSRANG